MLGLRTVLPGRYLPDVLLRLRETEKVRFSHCVPTILQMLLTGAQKTGQDAFAIRTGICRCKALPSPVFC